MTDHRRSNLNNLPKTGSSKHPDTPAGPRELLAWALYDFANSGYTTVVLTTIFSGYFVTMIAGSVEGISSGLATLLWALTIGTANLVVLISSPVVGAMADHRAIKKRFLFITTVGCVACTSLLALVAPGEIALAMILLIGASICFASGENLIAAFLPEITSQQQMGRVSGFGWSVGYFGGLLTLVICLAYITWATGQGKQENEIVPVTMLITAVIFALAATPTFLWLRERAVPATSSQKLSYVHIGLRRVQHTLRNAARYRDYFRFLIALAVFQSGVAIVVIMAAVYAREVMGFDSRQMVLLIMQVNLTAAIGAFGFGCAQDKFGSVPTLACALLVWVGAVILTFLADRPADLWLAGNLMGLGMGASQAGGRALIGQLTPPTRSGEFFGLWGMVNRLAAITGPLTYGTISYLSDGNHRLAILSALIFFIAGLILLTTINEQRGKIAASI